jgi:hypothetical protein
VQASVAWLINHHCHSISLTPTSYVMRSEVIELLYLQKEVHDKWKRDVSRNITYWKGTDVKRILLQFHNNISKLHSLQLLLRISTYDYARQAGAISL